MNTLSQFTSANSLLPLPNSVTDILSANGDIGRTVKPSDVCSIGSEDRSNSDSESSDDQEYLIVEHNDSILNNVNIPSTNESEHSTGTHSITNLDAREVTGRDVIYDAEFVGNVPAVMDAESTGVVADRVANSTSQDEPKWRTPVPTPRRSLRKRTQPNWMASRGFVCVQVATTDESSDNMSVLHHLIDLQLGVFLFVYKILEWSFVAFTRLII